MRGGLRRGASQALPRDNFHVLELAVFLEVAEEEDAFARSLNRESEVGAGHAEFAETLVIGNDAELFERLVKVGRRGVDFSGTEFLEEGHEEAGGGLGDGVEVVAFDVDFDGGAGRSGDAEEGDLEGEGDGVRGRSSSGCLI